MTSAILFKMAARSAVVVFFHVLNASCAAATAASTSASLASVNLASASPLTGL